MAVCGIKLATAGYGVYGIDYEGHGRSSGARCYIKKFDNIVADCDRFFKSICGNFYCNIQFVAIKNQVNINNAKNNARFLMHCCSGT
jgi:Serine aminopeptidase, S33